MRVAILFSGRIKHYRENYDNILSNIIQNNQVDIFLSHSPELNEDLEDFIRLYKPIIVLNDKIGYFDYTKYPKRDKNQGHNTMCMFVNRLRVFQLLRNYMKEKNVFYDAILSYRLDIIAQDKIDWSEIDSNTLYIPAKNDYGGINDQIAYGSINVMKKYMTIYNDLNNILEDGCIFHPESLLKKYLEKCRLIIERIRFRYEITR